MPSSQDVLFGRIPLDVFARLLKHHERHSNVEVTIVINLRLLRGSNGTVRNPGQLPRMPCHYDNLAAILQLNNVAPFCGDSRTRYSKMEEQTNVQ